jgi:hypothetical protein
MKRKHKIIIHFFNVTVWIAFTLHTCKQWVGDDFGKTGIFEMEHPRRFSPWVLYLRGFLFDLLLGKPCGIQHGFGEHGIAFFGVVNEHMGDGTYKGAVLDNGATAH